MLQTIEEKKKAKTAKLRLVVLNETEFWREDIQKACGKINRVYLFDSNQHTYCCEMTPSYTLIPLASFAVSENEVSEEMYEELLKGDSLNSEIMYMHVSSVDKMKTERASFSHSLDGGLRYYASEGKKYNDIIEAAKDYFSGNPQIC